MGMIQGNKKEQWCLDPEIRQLALRVIAENEDELGYIDPDKIIFSSVLGGASLKWWGKCTRLLPQVRLIPLHMVEILNHGDVEAIEAVDDDILDIRFIITINRDSIYLSGGSEIDQLLEITVIHELKHINEDMTKIIDHDTKDFKSILDRYGVHWQSGFIKDDNGVETSD